MLNEVGSLDEHRSTANKRQRDESNGNSSILSFDGNVLSTSPSAAVGTATGHSNQPSEFSPNRTFELPPPSDPASIRMDAMGLNDLLLFQMAYLTPLAGGRTFPEVTSTSERRDGSIGELRMVSTDGWAHPTLDLMNNANVNSLWSEMPAVFKCVFFSPP